MTKPPVESLHAFDYHVRAAATSAVEEARRGIDIHGPMASYAEAESILREEFEELVVELRSSQNIHVEALQVAAVALRIAAIANREVSSGQTEVAQINVEGTFDWAIVQMQTNPKHRYTFGTVFSSFYYDGFFYRAEQHGWRPVMRWTDEEKNATDWRRVA